MMLRIALVALTVCLAAAKPARAAVTDEDVRRAIERGKEFLLNLRNPDGTFTNEVRWRGCYTALVMMTLARLGEHPNRDVMTTGLNYLVACDADRDFNSKQGYALPIRVMALAYVHNRCAADRQAGIRQKMRDDIARLIKGQGGIGGWRYELNRADYDNSVSQWPILAFYEASRVGIEFPTDALKAARQFYFRGQHPDGGWGYQFGGRSYGSMTAAGLASLYIIADFLEPASGCPCSGGKSQTANLEIERRMDAALAWLNRNFSATSNPAWNWETNFDEVFYWLYCVERVGIAAGYKHFGQHNWYNEGAEFLIRRQLPDGGWEQIDPKLRTTIPNWGGGKVPDTCFALLFLYKGRAPVLFNKLRFDGTWNAHRRDIANLTAYIEKNKEQLFNWQIVDLAAPLEELHDAPVLFVAAESIPNFTPQDRAKLRAYTDSGGTILFEASCGNPAVRKWFTDFARETWPEWPLAPLGADHPVFADPYPLPQRPELMGIGDGLRTAVFYAADDVSCPWHMRAVAAREYLFQWGINIFTYAMDHAPLRAKLAGAEPDKDERYRDIVRPGPRRSLRIARLRHAGNWEAACNYGALQKLAAYLRNQYGLVLEVREPHAPPVTAGGVEAARLAGFDVAYLAASREFSLSDADRDALKDFVGKGGFLLAHAAGGAPAFEDSLRALAAACGWDLRPLPKDHPLMTGKMEGAAGYDLTQGVQFRRALRIVRAAKPWAEFHGLYAGDRMVGLFSPFDIEFSLSPFEAYGCRGYKPLDAGAVAMNVLFYLTTLPAPGVPSAAAP